MRYITSTLALLFLSGIISIKAQSGFLCMGGNISQPNGSITYSVGQCLFNQINGFNYNLIQGLQQPYEISNIVLIWENSLNQINVTIFPNPVSDFLYINANSSSCDNLQYCIYDLQSRLLESGSILSSSPSIDMSVYTPAVYFLFVSNGNEIIASFKVTKNK